MRKFYSLFFLAFAAASYAQVTLNIEGPNVACQQSCVELTAAYTGLSATGNYSVSPIPYSPSFPFTGGALINSTGDDSWSPVFNLPFMFSYYGTDYNSVLIGTNGVLTFDFVGQVPLGYCNWPFTATIPNAQFPIKNAIFGVYQDTNIATPPVTNPLIQNVNYYVLDTGANAAPNRVFVANFNELPQFQCDNSVGLQTSQVVLHESTNIIEIFVNKRTSCVTWNSGSGLIGLINGSGTEAVVPPGRNTGTWSTTNEAWRFTPFGEAITPTILWFENGNAIGEGETIVVCPTEGTNYTATLTYEGSPVVLTDQMDVSIFNEPLGVPFDMQVCGDGPTYVADLTTNMALVLGAVNPNDYEVTFYDNLNEAEIQLSPIGNPSSYMFTDMEIIYMGVFHMSTGCYEILPFSIEGFPTPPPPSGSATQTFTPGQTLANLVVNGQNILWYNQSTGGNLLPSTTLLVNGTTYYASQTVGGCESRLAPNRLAVTAMSTLNTTQFTAAQVRLYPNPAEQSLMVSFPQNIDGIEIMNILGQTMTRNAASGKEIKLDVGNLSSGSYFLKIKSANESVITKFIKK